MLGARYCRHHPRAKAGWSCPACHVDLCPDCVATQALGHRQAPIELCCHCRAGVTPLTEHRAQAVPFWQRVLDAPKFPLCAAGLLSLLVLGFVRALTARVGLSSMLVMGTGVFLLRQGLFWAFIFFIIRNSAEGANKMGVLGLGDIQSDVVTPALKGILSTALVWLPAAIYMAAASDGGVLGLLSYEGHKDPVVWALALVGMMYAPMALLAGATDLGFGQILNPIRIFSFIRGMGREYFVAVFAVAVALVVGRIADYVLALGLAHVSIPFLPRWLAETVSAYAAFVAARILGVLLFVRGEVLDWGRSEEYQVALLPGVRPRGTLPEKAARRSPELAREDAPQPETRPAPARDQASLARLLRAVAEAHLDEALEIYRDLSGCDSAIPPAVHMQIGKAASKSRDFAVAAHAFKHVASGHSEHAGAGLVALAQVAGDGQKDLDRARKLYLQAIERFPQTEIAAFARQRLDGLPD